MQSANALLDWMTDHHLPLSLFRESNGDWVVVDASIDAVLGRGASAYDALIEAHEKEQ